MITARDKIDTLRDTSERQSRIKKCKKIFTAQIEAVAEYIPITPITKCRLPWVLITVRKKNETT